MIRWLPFVLALLLIRIPPAAADGAGTSLSAFLAGRDPGPVVAARVEAPGDRGFAAGWSQPIGGRSSPGVQGLLSIDTIAAAGAAGDGGARSLYSILEGPPRGTPDMPRLLVSWGAIAAVVAGYLVYGFDKWWDDVREPFHYSREGNMQADSYVGGVDKLGHAWSCHFLTRGCSALLRWSGVEPWLSTAVSALLVQAVFLFAEIEDGYFDYGWSDADEVANILGSLLAAALDLVPWLDDLIDFRMWYQATPYLYRGAREYNTAEDYSGQKYFLVLKGGGVPWFKDTAFRYLEFYVGYHAPGYRRYREVHERRVFVGFSLDVGRVLADLLFPKIDAPGFLRGWSSFVFEHWQPHFIHAPMHEWVLGD